MLPTKTLARLSNNLNISVLVAIFLPPFHPFPIFFTPPLSCGGTRFDFCQCVLSSGAFFGSRVNMDNFGKSRKWSQVTFLISASVSTSTKYQIQGTSTKYRCKHGSFGQVSQMVSVIASLTVPKPQHLQTIVKHSLQNCYDKNMDYRSTQVLPAFIATFGAFGCGTGIAWPSVVQQQIE